MPTTTISKLLDLHWRDRFGSAKYVSPVELLVVEKLRLTDKRKGEKEVCVCVCVWGGGGGEGGWSSVTKTIKVSLSCTVSDFFLMIFFLMYGGGGIC